MLINFSIPVLYAMYVMDSTQRMVDYHS